jgi:hypothetical protein
MATRSEINVPEVIKADPQAALTMLFQAVSDMSAKLERVLGVAPEQTKPAPRAPEQHPVDKAILDYLSVHTYASATQLTKQVPGEHRAKIHYHMSQLAKAGKIVCAERYIDGKQNRMAMLPQHCALPWETTSKGGKA